MTSDLLRSVIEGMPPEFAGPDDDYARTREQMAPLHGHPLAADTTVVRLELGGVRAARLARPDSDDRRGLALFLHGGGFVSCDLEDYLFYAEVIATRLAIPVITVDYRLAPDIRARQRWTTARLSTGRCWPRVRTRAGSSALGTPVAAGWP